MATYTNSEIVLAAIRGQNAQTRNGNFSTDAYRAGFSRRAPYVGYLPPKLASILDARFAEGAITQVIYSYSTPIAWLDAGAWIIPDVTYSATTSRKHAPHLSDLSAREYVPWDISLEEYMRVLNGHMRYVRPEKRNNPGRFVAR